MGQILMRWSLVDIQIVGFELRDNSLEPLNSQLGQNNAKSNLNVLNIVTYELAQNKVRGPRP